jgi:hypothetical protein
MFQYRIKFGALRARLGVLFGRSSGGKRRWRRWSRR